MRTKIVGYLILLVSILNLGIDLVDGNGFEIQRHWNEITTALAGMGLVFLRAGVEKVKQ